MTLAGRSFSAKDISAILKACHQCGVSEVSFGDLHVSFNRGLHGNADLQKTPLQQAAPSLVEENPKEIGMPKVEYSDLEKEMFREVQVNQLMLDDPVAFEQYLIDEQQSRDGFLNEEGRRPQ